ncbi:MAG: ATP--guanido phosphotransferase, partial [Oscillospiraceae bacterium]
QFTENTKGKAILMARDESVCVMLNEEDHIRIQVLCTGLDLEKSLETALKIDQFFDNHLKYAFDENFGYLTSCPTNIGTGLRASVMLHLMGLEKTGLIAKLASTISQMGLTIRGTFGEGTKAQNYYYQVSNQITLGITEEQVIKNLKSITMQIIKKEYDAQKQFILNGNDADDKIHRMLGILKYAKKISYAEMCTIISDLRLGICQKFINLQPYVLNSMINTLSGACIEVEQGEKISPENRDMIRSLKIKQYLKEV